MQNNHNSIQTQMNLVLSSSPLSFLVFGECHLAADIVGDDGEVGEEVVADDAFRGNSATIQSRLVVASVSTKDLERVACELAWNAAHGSRPRPAVKRALVSDTRRRKFRREVVYVGKCRAAP